MFIKPGNRKTGPFCYTFSLPPVLTCPGSTEECRRVCYAHRMCKFRPSILTCWLRNYDLAKDQIGLFEYTLRLELQLVRPPYFRIHVAGDFFSKEYLDAWVRIAAAVPDTKFLAFTKAPWDLPQLPANLCILRSPEYIPVNLQEARELYPKRFICPASRNQKHDVHYRTGCNTCGYHCWSATESPVFLLH